MFVRDARVAVSALTRLSQAGRGGWFAAWSKRRNVRRDRPRGIPSTALLLGSVFFLALAARLAFAFKLPSSVGDWFLYSNVAKSILAGCGVAVSLPGHAACVPHFGGNQLPLFPGFVAGLWYVFGQTEWIVRVGQSVLASAATMWLALAVLRLTGSRYAAFAAGGLIALSPIGGFWAGSLLTETLALATTQWVIAELMLSFAEKRLRTGFVALALTAAIWIRLDGILLVVPVLLSALSIGGVRSGMRAACLVGAMVGTPLALWAVRNVAVGISPLPVAWVLPDGSRGPSGYMAWTHQWVASVAHRADATWFGVGDYKRIKIDPAAFSSEDERVRVEALLAELRQHSGEPFPPAIDAAFADLAARRAAHASLQDRVQLFAKRTWSLTSRWIWPWADAGDGRQSASMTDYYRFGIVVSWVGVLLVARQRRLLLAAPAVYILVRAAFFAVTVNIEPRYMIEIAPFLETSVGVGLALTVGHALAGWRLHRWKSSTRQGLQPATSLG